LAKILCRRKTKTLSSLNAFPKQTRNFLGPPYFSYVREKSKCHEIQQAKTFISYELLRVLWVISVVAAKKLQHNQREKVCGLYQCILLLNTHLHEVSNRTLQKCELAVLKARNRKRRTQRGKKCKKKD
jgi:hypothetical protein